MSSEVADQVHPSVRFLLNWYLPILAGGVALLVVPFVVEAAVDGDWGGFAVTLTIVLGGAVFVAVSVRNHRQRSKA